MANTLYLVLENGAIFKGKSFGVYKDVIGEVVFSTGMNGYIETLTDSSYCGQMVVQTYPLIGNYGIISNDFENNKPMLKAYIVKNWCHNPSNFRSEGDIDTFLKSNNIVGLYDIDTRALTKIIRQNGVMNGRITSSIENIKKQIEDIKNYKPTNLIASVSSKQIKVYKSNNTKYKIVLWDFGAKKSIIGNLVKRNCEVIVVPYNTTAEKIESFLPDGIILSNGPGNPKDNTNIIGELKKLSGYKIPTFGICLGHQLLALSQGATTRKLKYGHRSLTHPVKDKKSQKIYITSQNHGYAVEESSLPMNAEISFYSVNDNTCEGIKYKNIPAFSVQFHPEASAGPHDTEFLFDKFLEIVDRR